MRGQCLNGAEVGQAEFGRVRRDQGLHAARDAEKEKDLVKPVAARQQHVDRSPESQRAGVQGQVPFHDPRPIGQVPDVPGYFDDKDRPGKPEACPPAGGLIVALPAPDQESNDDRDDAQRQEMPDAEHFERRAVVFAGQVLPHGRRVSSCMWVFSSRSRMARMGCFSLRSCRIR